MTIEILIQEVADLIGISRVRARTFVEAELGLDDCSEEEREDIEATIAYCGAAEDILLKAQQHQESLLFAENEEKHQQSLINDFHPANLN